MDIVKTFWAPQGKYTPCGMFTKDHLILLLLCIALLFAMLSVTKNINAVQFQRVLRVLGILVLALEIIKILYNIAHGYLWLDAWFPIAFCSIFIYALIFTGFGKNGLKTMGDAFLGSAAMVAGATFLISPTTSLMLYPAWHFLSLYSMLFHTMMVYVGIQYIRRQLICYSCKTFIAFGKIYILFASIAVILNSIYHCNLMLLREPYHIYIPFLHELKDALPWCYTLLAFLVYLFVPYSITKGIDKYYQYIIIKHMLHNKCCRTKERNIQCHQNKDLREKRLFRQPFKLPEQRD